MATTPPSSTEATTPDVKEVPKKGRLLRVLLFVLVLLVVAASSAAAMWFWAAHRAPECGTPAGTPLTPAEAPVAPAAAPIFMSMEPFTVSVQSESMERMMHVRVNLRLKDDQTRERLENYLPEVRNRVLMLLSAQSPEAITTPDGKTALAQAINHVLTQPFSPLTDEQSIMDVLFTEFVVQ